MKKILFILAAAMLCTVQVNAAQLTAEYEYNSTSNGFVVSGKSDDSMTGDEVTVEAYLNGVLFDCVVTQTYNDGGASVYKTDIIPIDSSKESGTINFSITSANSDSAVKTGDFTYYGMSDVYPILKEISNAISDKNYRSLISLLNGNADKLGIQNVSDKAAESIKNYALGISLALPNDCGTSENREKVFEQLLYLRGEVKILNMIGEFALASSSAELAAAYERYGDTLDFTSYGDKAKYLKSNYKTDKFFTVVKSKPIDFAAVSELKDRLIECGAMSEIANGNASAVNNIFTDFSDKLTKNYSVSSVVMSNIFSKMAGNTYSSYADASKAYNDLAYAALNNNTSSPTGCGGSSTGGSSNPPATMPDDTKTNNEIFTDMDGAAWAKTAVKALYEKGIVSGKTNTEFYPNDAVTRAEFAKLLVMCRNALVKDNTQYFNDVAENSWYFDYVNSAYLINAVNGDDNGNFNPNDKITRQDMAVMIYRAMNMSDTDLPDFTDSDEISDYAVNAVGALYRKGIVSGMGNGSFAPRDFATRAQAAQMIYKLISK